MDLIMDTETNGLTKPTFVSYEEQPHIVEIAVILVDDRGEIVWELDQIVNPGVPIGLMEGRRPFSHGITDEMVADKPRFADLIPMMREKFCLAKRIIGHNIRFDCDMLNHELRRAECDYFPIPQDQIDTVHEYQHLFGYRPTLKQLYEKTFGEEFVGVRHRAMEDVKTLYKILKKDGWWSCS